MAADGPLVSILITTYNRSHLLRRAIDSVLGQDFDDYELVIIDDCSPDDTREVVASINDPRIRYIRNETNVGSKVGDRAILRQFVYELMRGKYFVYLCDDDYWLFPDLLSRQVEAFRTHDNVAMVMGGQLAYFLSTPESYFGHPVDNPLKITLENLDRFFDRTTRKTKSPHFYFHGSDKPLFPEGVMTPEFFLSKFAKEPTTKNIIGGAMLYSRDIFIRSGALKSEEGSQWQAGYELKLGPPCYGNTIYFDEPSIVSEIRASNASFQRTQVEHYLDSIESIELAFETPLADESLRERRRFLKKVKDETICNLSTVFLVNGLTILREGAMGLCSEDNIKHPVRLHHVIPVLIRNKMLPGLDLLRHGATFERELANQRIERMKQHIERVKQHALQIPQLAEHAILYPTRLIWRKLPQCIRDVLRPS